MSLDFLFALTNARGFTAVAALLLVVSTGCGNKTEARGAGTPGHEFVFTVNREGWNEIWLMDESGRNRRRLTEAADPRRYAAGNTSARWSPDGTRIAFVSTGNSTERNAGAEEIYVMDANGGNKTRLTSNHDPDWSPDWSHDGKRLVFARATKWGSAEANVALYVMDADGSGEDLLYSERAERGVIFLLSPAWSPDGASIAFTRAAFSNESARTDVYVMKSDGTNPTKIASDAAGPAWSPDGSRIAFTSGRDRAGETCFHECDRSGEIYVADTDGDNPRRLTRSEADDHSPTWSPDGKQIAFVSDRSNRNDHENEIYVVDSDGGDPTRITRNSVWDLEPNWRLARANRLGRTRRTRR